MWLMGSYIQIYRNKSLSSSCQRKFLPSFVRSKKKKKKKKDTTKGLKGLLDITWWAWCNNKILHWISCIYIIVNGGEGKGNASDVYQCHQLSEGFIFFLVKKKISTRELENMKCIKRIFDKMQDDLVEENLHRQRCHKIINHLRET